MARLTPKQAGLLSGSIAFLFASTVINLQPNGWISWYHLATEGKKAKAAVTQRLEQNHQTCSYTYSVDSDKYEGRDEGCRFAVGQTIDITYSPEKPSFSTSSSPSTQLGAMILGPFALSLIGGMLTARSVSRRQLSR
jgi:hypothetical protein